MNVVPLNPIADPARRIGTVELGDFQLEEIIGRGSHGTTYLATQLGFDRKVVVKVAHAERFDARGAELVRRRFADELRAATRVAHPNLVTLYTAGETAEGLPAVAMELVRGQTLERVLEAQSGGLPLPLLESTFLQLAAALAALHERGLVHGDLSPRSVMLDPTSGERPKLKVLDFGLAVLRGHPQHSGASSSTDYTAPEQLIGRTVPASDMFALGAILWRALTGQAFHSDTRTLQDLHTHEPGRSEPVDPRRVAPGLPARLSQLVGRLLAHAEYERPTAEAFLAAWPAMIAELREPAAPRPHTAPQLPPPPPIAPLVAATRPALVQPMSKRPRPLVGARSPLRLPEPPSVGAPPSYDSLPAIDDEAAASPRAAPRVLVVDANAITQHLLVGSLRRSGCRVHGTRDPREATRGAADDYDLVILSTEIPDADPLDVARYMQEYHPEQWLALAGEGELDEAMRAAGVRALLVMPGGMTQLGALVDELRAAMAQRVPATTHEPAAIDGTVRDAMRTDAPVVREAIEMFVGQTPECLARIDEAYELGSTKIMNEQCRLLSASARALGANELSRLALSTAELVRSGRLERLPGLIAAMEREYGRVFRALMHAHATSHPHGATP